MQTEQQYLAELERRKSDLQQDVMLAEESISLLTKNRNELKDEIESMEHQRDVLNQTIIQETNLQINKKNIELKSLQQKVSEKFIPLEKKEKDLKELEAKLEKDKKEISEKYSDAKHLSEITKLDLENIEKKQIQLSQREEVVKENEKSVKNMFDRSVSDSYEAEKKLKSADLLLRVEHKKNEELLRKIKEESDLNSDKITEIENKNKVLQENIRINKEIKERANSQLRQLTYVKNG